MERAFRCFRFRSVRLAARKPDAARTRQPGPGPRTTVVASTRSRCTKGVKLLAEPRRSILYVATDSKRAEIGQAPSFKQIYSGPRFVNNTFNLGSHYHATAAAQTAPGLTVVHYRRSYEEYVRLATQTIISHGYIDATDSSAEMIQKLKPFDKRPECTVASCHKNWIVLDDLQNRTKMRSAYYASNGKARPVLQQWRDYLREIFRMYPSLLRE